MKLKRAAIAGACFGFAAIAGGFAAVATDGGESEADAFSADRLGVLTSTDIADLPLAASEGPVGRSLDGSSLHGVINGAARAVYVAERDDSSICLLLVDNGTVGMSCGSPDDVTAGGVAFVLSYADGSDGVFVGLAPNDVETVMVGDVAATLANNVWIAEVGVGVETFTMSSGSHSVTIDVGDTQSDDAAATASSGTLAGGD